MYIQLIQSVWAESRSGIVHYLGIFNDIAYRHDFVHIPTGSAVCIWRNILVFHFASYSIYNYSIL